ncbi:MAG: hypothetical protein ACTSVI_01905 [Promethearchaeota archaeon]
MNNKITINFPHATFKPLSKTLIDLLLKRTFEYLYFDVIKKYSDFIAFNLKDTKYEVKIVEISRKLVDDGWNLSLQELSEINLPIFMLEKGYSTILISGVESGDQNFIGIMLSTDNLPELQKVKRNIKSLARI